MVRNLEGYSILATSPCSGYKYGVEAFVVSNRAASRRLVLYSGFVVSIQDPYSPSDNISISI